MECPYCGAPTRKFGFTATKIQRFRCDDCRKTFTRATENPLGVMRLPMDKAATVLHHLLEGNSVRSTQRLTGVGRNTILALLVHVGANCKRMLDAKLANVCVNDIEADEIWSFVGCKERTRAARQFGMDRGDAYCFVALEASTKLVVAWHLGKRSPEDTAVFAKKLDKATSGRFQMTTDGFTPYKNTIPQTFGDRVDFSQLVKVYGSAGVEDQRRYSPPTVIGTTWEMITGQPTQARASTSYVERGNLSIRMAVRRFTRLTNAYSKKWRNHEAALALWFAFYNYCRRHMTLKETPAQASGLENHRWTIRELIEESAKH